MPKSRHLFVTTVFLLGLIVVSIGEARAETKLLLVGEGVGRDSLSPDDPLFKTILDRLSSDLKSAGVDVTLAENEASPQATGRPRPISGQALHDLSKSRAEGGAPFAGAVSIFATTDKDRFATKVTTGLSVRLFVTATSNPLGTVVQQTPGSVDAPADCGRHCLLDIVASSSGDLTKRLASKLAKELASRQETPSSGKAAAFRLVLKGYSRDDVREIEAFLPAFKGYRGHSVIEASPTQNVYRYDTSLKSTALTQNLERMLRYVGVPGRVTAEGTLFTVENRSGGDSR